MDTSNSLLSIFEQPNENGIVVFVLGILFILSIYHFLLYFQHKDRVYLYYSLYTFLIFFNHLWLPPSGFIEVLTKPLHVHLTSISLPIMWLYNAVYFIFGFTFINFKNYNQKWNSIIFKTIFFIIIYSAFISLLSLFTSNMNYIYNNNLVIVSFFFLFGLICYYPLFKSNHPLKYYIILGSMVLYISSLISFYIVNTDTIGDGIGYSIFYIGIIIENIIFTLGLGHKQKLILDDKNESHKNLILQLKENEKLRLTLQEQAEKDVASYSKQAEKEKFEKLKVEYDKELAELKISSLRSQMNPHFIFNSLNAIKLYIIDSDKENAVYYLNKFSKLIRKILATTREKEISLADEIETLKLYIDIENIRFNNEIVSSIKIDENLNIDTLKIPSLILQPFIENAIWHGLSSKKDIKKIDISFEKEAASHLKITIEDNGIGRKKSAEIKNKKIHKKESIGIQLTEERLANFEKDYQNNYSINFIDLYDNKKNATGTKVIIKIPIK